MSEVIAYGSAAAVAGSMSLILALGVLQAEVDMREQPALLGIGTSLALALLGGFLARAAHMSWVNLM